MITPARPDNSSRRWLRPLAVLIASLLLHLLLLDWATGRLGPAGPHQKTETVLLTTLEPPAVPAPPPPPPKPAAPKPKPVPRQPRAPRAAVAQSAAPSAPAQPVESEPQGAPAVAMAEPTPTPEPVPEPAPETPQAPPPRVLKTQAPPSAELKYDVEALRNGKLVYGSGKIGFRSSGDNYVIDGEAGVLFFSVLTFRSVGSIEQDGITPLRYSEKRFRKAETNTHFQREAGRISFSASTASYPRAGGEQDRASIIWQLAAIGRGDPSQFSADSEFDIFVAGVRDAETWRIRVVGEEQIHAGGDNLTAWHLLRMPRPGSYDTQVDIWLAPSRQWYPVKLRQTETNGDYLDMSMSSITPLAAQ